MTDTSGPGVQIPVATLPNLRDLGGWPTRDGRRIRHGQIYRSTDLDRLDADGLCAVGKLRLRTVVDLRTVPERQAQPDRLPDGVASLHCDVLADARNAAPALLPKIMADPKTAGDILGGGKSSEMFEQGYRDIVSLPSALSAYRDFFLALADDGRRPLLFHCATGKDRTGWAAAATLALLGVEQADIMQEYLLTNSQLLPALQPVLDGFKHAGGDPALLEPVLGVRAEYLEAALDEMHKTFGSWEGYFETGLGLDADTQHRLGTRLTEEITQ